MAKLTGNEPAIEYVNNPPADKDSIIDSTIETAFTVRQLLAKDFMRTLYAPGWPIKIDSSTKENAIEAAKKAFILADAFIEVNNQLEEGKNG